MDRGALQITVHEITKRDKTEQKSQHISDRRLISKLRNSYNSNKLNLEKAEEPEIKLPTSAGSSKKQESSRKTSYFCFFLTLTVWITTAVENSSRDGNTRPPYLPPDEPVCRLRSNS